MIIGRHVLYYRMVTSSAGVSMEVHTTPIGMEDGWEWTTIVKGRMTQMVVIRPILS